MAKIGRVQTGQNAAIRAIIFDLGEVLAKHVKFARVANEAFLVSAPGKLDWSQPAAIEMLKKFELGLVEPQEFFESVLPFMEERISFEEFSKEWVSIFEIMQPVARLVKRLKSNGYKIGIISNTDQLAYEKILQDSGIGPFVDSSVTSFRVHAKKPEKKIFEVALEELDVAPEKCVFIDDSEKNVKAAQSFGLNAIRFTNYRALLEELKSLGVKTGQNQ